MDTNQAKKKIEELQNYLYSKPEEYKRLLNDKEALMKERGLDAELIANFKIAQVKDASARGGCKCSSWCGFGCFYGPKVGAEGESCVG